MTGLGNVRRLDWPLVVAVLALVVFSWPYMKSASYRSGPEGQGYYTSSPERQLLWVALGGGLGVLVLVVGYRSLCEAAVVLYAGGLALLAAVLVFGREVNGAKSWMDLPGGFRLQPSEVAKITTVIVLARFLSAEREVKRLGGVVTALLIAAVPAGLVAMQPDLGSALMFVPAAVAMIFAAGARLRHLVVLGLATVALLPAAWLGLNENQRGRITAWLEQGRPLTPAERVGRFHHLIQSKTAIGSGGWTGKGLGKGTQNRLNYVWFRNTDFIFAVICEEGGFVGANVVLVLYLVVAASGLGIGQRCREPMGRLVAVGAVSLLVAQGLINVAMTVGLLPIVGVTLPFVSYGGSSTLSSFMGVALLLSVGLRRLRVAFAREELGAAAFGYRS